MTATLSAHAGGYKCDLDTVRKVKAPKPTDEWYPIPHGDLIDMLFERLSAKSLKVDKRKAEYALAKDGAQMFATFNLLSEKRPDFTLALGLRNSINKSLSAGICCGSRVFVCDNLAFSSDIVFRQKHYGNFLEVMPEVIDAALGRFVQDGEEQEKLFDRMKKVAIEIPLGMEIINEIGEKHKFLQKPRLHEVMMEFVKPRFQEFRDQGHTAWTLLNACTTHCRHDRMGIDPKKEQENLLGIQRVIADRFSIGMPVQSTN